MPVLKNVKHERFAQLIADGMSITDAYHEVGGTGTPQAASNLRRTPRISARIAEIIQVRAKVADRAAEKAIERAAEKKSLDKYYVLDRLMTVVEKAMGALDPEDGKFNAGAAASATKALQLLGVHQGMFVNRVERGEPGEFAELDADGIKSVIAERLSALTDKTRSTH